MDRYLQHLHQVTGGREPTIEPVSSNEPFFTIDYLDWPEPGLLTAFTYGLSLASHPSWQRGKPELCITVESTDTMLWAVRVGSLAMQLRGRCPFSYGNTIDLGSERLAEDSTMTAFVVFRPTYPAWLPDVLKDRAVGPIDVGDELPINIAAIYPIHRSELELIQADGLERFWHLDWDPYDTRRSPATPVVDWNDFEARLANVMDKLARRADETLWIVASSSDEGTYTQYACGEGRVHSEASAFRESAQPDAEAQQLRAVGWVAPDAGGVNWRRDLAGDPRQAAQEAARMTVVTLRDIFQVPSPDGLNCTAPVYNGNPSVFAELGIPRRGH